MNRILALLYMAALVACSPEKGEVFAPMDEPYVLELPAGFPMPVIPEENQLTKARVELGRRLFFEPRLSRGALQSCASCHFPDRAFSDTVAKSIGVGGHTGLRNSPPLMNLAWHNAFFRDGGIPSLELQVLAPIHDPLEMDFNINAAAELMRDEEPYSSLSTMAYGRQLDGFVITRSIASFMRTLVSGHTSVDRFLLGESGALNAAEQRGWVLFSGPDANCMACHGGFDFSDHGYHNVGQYLDYADPGRQRITLADADRGKFKTPSLRNVALTAPYMHDGSMGTLEEVIDHFASGGLPHPNRSPLLQPFTLSAQDKADLIAFLRALTNEQFEN